MSGGTPVPVVVGVGQVTHRDDENVRAAEPLALIAAAARASDADTGGDVLAHVDAIELMPVGAWPYDDLGALVADQLHLDVPPARRRVHPTGGETPLRTLDVAAARIASGDARIVLIAGAEGTRAVARARRAGTELPWTPPGAQPTFPAFSAGLARASAVGISRALNCFPLYEHGLRAHEGRSLADAEAESAAMWAGLARVAAANPYAWTRSGADERDVAAVGPGNRMISYPYPKSLTANPFVNQGAAVLVTDTATARFLGVPEDRWVYPLGGAGADEPEDPRARVAYHRVPALDATIRDLQEVTGVAVHDVDHVELYSCFPAMPKLTRRAMGRPVDAPVSSIGGLSFFGGPGSNYLTHALATMVERIRSDGGIGMAHGVGMFNTKHHALVLADRPRADGRYPRPAHDVGVARPPVETPVPVVEDYAGPATVLTCTVMFDREGRPERGAVICTGPHGERLAAIVRDRATLDELTSGVEPVGRTGTVTLGALPDFSC